MAFDIYQTVTDKILTALESGVVPWKSAILGSGAANYPTNFANKKRYRGVNVFLLAMTAFAEGYESSYWLSYKQAAERGGQVRKGEKSTMVVFWTRFDAKDKKTGEDKKIPLMRYYNVFNLSQIDGIEAPDVIKNTKEFSPIEECEKIVAGYADGPKIQLDGGSKASYRPTTDSVHMPKNNRFESPERRYCTLFHELGHSTGHSSRLDRKFDTAFGSELYGKEELIAEMTAAFLCATAGISPATIENSASYIAGWTKGIKGDKKLVVAAAGAAQRAMDRILGTTFAEPQQAIVEA